MDPTTSSGVYIFHDPQVISSIIAAIPGVIIGFFGLFAGKSNRTVKKALWGEQLKNLYEPLDYLLSFSNYESAYELLHEIKSIISKNYRYLTPDIQNVINELCKKEDLSMSDFQELKILVSSTYNWLRKKLSYPYNKASIQHSTRVIHAKTIFTSTAITSSLLSAFSALLVFISSMYLSNSEIVPPPADDVWTSTISILYIIVLLVVTVFMFIEDIMDGFELLLFRLEKLFPRIISRKKGNKQQ